MLAFRAPSPTEWMLILIIVLVLFGVKKLPEFARGLGQTMNEFRKARGEFDRELQQAANGVKAPPSPPAPPLPEQAASVQTAPGPAPIASRDLPPEQQQR